MHHLRKRVRHHVGEGGACLHAEACPHTSLLTKLRSILVQQIELVCARKKLLTKMLFEQNIIYTSIDMYLTPTINLVQQIELVCARKKLLTKMLFEQNIIYTSIDMYLTPTIMHIGVLMNFWNVLSLHK